MLLINVTTKQAFQDLPQYTVNVRVAANLDYLESYSISLFQHRHYTLQHTNPCIKSEAISKTKIPQQLKIKAASLYLHHVMQAKLKKIIWFACL